MERKYDIQLPVFDATRPQYTTVASINEKAIATLKMDTGTVLIGSDAHLWPGELTTAQRGFLRFAKELRPHAVILNGDVFDGAQISRHPSIGWEKRPKVHEELEAVRSYVDQVKAAAPGAKRFWTAGNHDLRFESKLAAMVPEMAKVQGMHLKDHFPDWTPCWRVDINDDVVVKHRWANGLHAVYNNTLRSGKTMVTGHLHSLKVTPWTDYNGDRFGVDSGTLAEPHGPQFLNYLEAGPTNWRSGFVVLTFRDGRLMWPSLAAKWDEDHMQYQGELIKV